MAVNVKTSAETAASALDGTEQIRGVQSSANVKITAAQIKTYARTFSGAMVEKSADETTANYTTATAIAFNQESYDVGGWHDNASNNSRLTVPSGVSYVRVGANVAISATTADTWKTLQLFKNGSAAFDGACGTEQEVGDTGILMTFTSGPIAVVATDYFEVKLREESDTSITVIAAQTNFWIEAIA